VVSRKVNSSLVLWCPRLKIIIDSCMYMGIVVTVAIAPLLGGIQIRYVDIGSNKGASLTIQMVDKHLLL
jgi:hypothetical protein